MRVQTVLGILTALVTTVLVAYLTQQNTELLQQRFRLTDTGTAPMYAVLICIFLLGFLPVVTLLVIKTLKQDLAIRRQRRFERETRSLQAGYRRAIDLLGDGQWPRAAAELEAVLADQPEDFSTLLHLGEAHRRQGKVAEALDIHRRASVLYPQSVAILYQLAADYEAEGTTEVAEEIRDRVLRDFSGLGLQVLKSRRDEAVTRQEWAVAQRLQESIDTLLAESGSTVEDAEEEALRRGLTFQQGVSLLESEQYQAGGEVFSSILEKSPEFVPAWILLGESSLLAGDVAAALGRWREGWQSTGSPTFLQRIEDHFIEREDPLEAIATLRRIIAESENDLLPRFFLAKLYSRLEMHDEALKVLGSIRDRVHESPALLCLLGQLHERRGERSEAGRAFRASLELAKISQDLYLCGRCGAESGQWSPCCAKCGRWNTIGLHFEIEPVGGEDLVIQERPIWPVDGKS